MDGLVSNVRADRRAWPAPARPAPHRRPRRLRRPGRRRLLDGDGRVHVRSPPRPSCARAEIAVERTELDARPEAELAELAELYRTRGLDPELARRGGRAAVPRPRSRPGACTPGRSWASTRTTLPSPWIAAGSSFVSFAVGGLLPLLPYLLGADSLAAAAVLAAAGLFGAGAADRPVHGAPLDLHGSAAVAPRCRRSCGDVLDRLCRRCGDRLTPGLSGPLSAVGTPI